MKHIHLVRPAFRWAFIAVLLAMGLMLTEARPARAIEFTHTYVSGTGNDGADCSRGTPCRSLPGAYGKTVANGEIICLDNSEFSGGGGGLLIVKPVRILCGASGGVFRHGAGIAINVNVPAGQVVILEGLTISGSAEAATGIHFGGGKLLVEDCEIFGFNAGVGRGIFASGQSGGVSQLFVNDSSVHSNGMGTGGPIVGGAAIVIGETSAPAPGVVRAVLSNVKLEANNMGLRTSPSSETTVKDSTISGNVSFNVLAASGGGANLVNLDGVDASESVGGTGLRAEGVGAIIRVNRSTVLGNNLGLHPLNGGVISTTGTNLVTGNFGGNGAFNGSVPLS